MRLYMQGERRKFATWVSRCHGLLYFTACRVLGTTEGAEEAVQNCLLAASRNPPSFESEGAFRSWLLRILIDEALLILRENTSPFMTSSETVFSDQRCDG